MAERMKKTFTVLLATSLLLSGCGWRSWFGRNDAPPAGDLTAIEPTNPLIPQERRSVFKRDEPQDNSVLIERVTKLQIDQTPTGAIILAEGIANRQGAYGSMLRPTGEDLVSEDGVLNLEFRVIYPGYPTPVGSERSREVTDALSLTRQELRNVKQVVVTGSGNAMQSRRR